MRGMRGLLLVVFGFALAMALIQWLERIPVTVPPVDRGHPALCEYLREC